MNIAIPNWSALNDRLLGQLAFVSLTQNIQPSHDVVAPSDIQDGDLLYYIDCCNESGVGAAAPTGFTSDVSLNDGDRRLILSSKLADGTEASSTLTGMGGSNETSASLLVFRASPVAANQNRNIDAEGDISSFGIGPLAYSQANQATEWGSIYAASVAFMIWMAPSSPADWGTTASANAGDSADSKIANPWVPASSDKATAPAIHGDSADISNGMTATGLLLTYVTVDAGLDSGISGFGAVVTGDINRSSSGYPTGYANIIAMYEPTISGA